MVLAHGSGVSSLAALADGRLASGGANGTIKLWPKEAAGEREPAVLQHGGTVWSLAVLADGRLVSGGYDGKIKLWPKAVRASRWSSSHGGPSGPWRCWRTGGWPAAAYDGNIKLWPKEGTGEPAVRAQGRWVGSLAALADRRPATRRSARKADRWGRSRRWRRWQTGGWPAATISARSSSGPRTVPTNRWFSRTAASVRSLAALADGRLASGGSDGKIKLWPTEGKGEPVSSRITAAWSGRWRCWRTGGWRAAATDGKIKLWPKDGKGEPVVLAHGGGMVRSLAVLADGRLASGGEDGKIKLWPKDGMGEPVVLAHGGRVLSLAVLADGRLASGGEDGKIKLWPKEGTGEPVVLAHGGAGHGRWRCWRTGGWRAAATDGKIKLWPKEGTDEPVVLAHGGPVWSLAVLADGRLASGGEDGTIKLWLVDEQKLIAALCLRAGRNLTKAEWARYIGSDTPWQPSCRDLPSNWRTTGPVTRYFRIVR